MSKSLNLFIICFPHPPKNPKTMSKFSPQEHSVDRISLKGLEINRVAKSPPQTTLFVTISLYVYITIYYKECLCYIKLDDQFVTLAD